MFKTILIPAGAEAFDDAIVETALRVAQPAAAHIELHYFCSAHRVAAETVRQVGWAVGGAAAPAVRFLDEQIEQQSCKARAAFAELCRRKGVELVDERARSTSVTASWHATRDNLARLADHARHADLIVMGRPGAGNGLARSHIEAVLAGSGRPVLIAPSVARSSISGTVFVCWKESPESARALGAALPLLMNAHRVILASVDEGNDAAGAGLYGVARNLGRHGIEVETRVLAPNRPVPEVLAAAADAHDADLIVLGAYGHSKAHEIVFGGCTRAFLNNAPVPVLMMQ